MASSPTSGPVSYRTGRFGASCVMQVVRNSRSQPRGHLKIAMAELGTARAAIDEGDWDRALTLLVEIPDSDLDVDDLELLAVAAYWTGQGDVCIDARERAFALHLDSGDVVRAGEVATALAESNFHQLKEAIGNSWLGRAEELLAEAPDSVEAGWLARMKGVIAFEANGDPESALTWIDLATEIADRHGNVDLRAITVQDRGRMLVATGQVEEGLSLMETVMTMALAGELAPIVAGKVYCNMIDICDQLGDYRRANEWSEAAERWCEQSGHQSGFPGVCRIKRAKITRLHGKWDQAEAEAQQACAELRDFLDFVGRGHEEIGTIRLHRGDHRGAEEAYQRALELGREPQPGMALLRLRVGDVDAAKSLIARALDGDLNPLEVAGLLPAQVEIELAAGDLTGARRAADQLATIATEYGTEALAGAAAYADGTVLAAEGDLVAAVNRLRASWESWRDCELPYEGAITRIALSQVYFEQEEVGLAQLEAKAARNTLSSLGAAGALAEIDRLLVNLEGGRLDRPVTSAWLFSDIVDSTALIQVVGDETWTSILRWHDRELRTLFAEHGGVEIDHAGDGFFVAFGDPAFAIACAIAIQETVRRHRVENGYPAQVRIGVHAGRAIDSGQSHTGREVHRAARIAGAAVGGEILVSVSAAESAPSSANYGEPRNLTAKGFSDPFQVVSVLPVG